MKRRARSGYTMMELTLVMALVVVVGGLSIPALDSMQAAPRLSAATDIVRSRWSETRTRAVEERRVYRFAVKDNTGSYRLAPDTTDFWSSSTNTDDGTSGLPGVVTEGTLPDNVVFSPDDGSNGGSSSSGGSGDWRTVATFQPDGTSTDDVSLSLQTPGTTPATLRIRSTTGAIGTASLPVTSNQQ